MRLYLIDDHSVIRFALKLMLEDLDSDLGKIEVTEAGNAAEAINYPHKDEIDLILLDLNMPGLSGLEALSELQKLYACNVVILSSEDQPKIILGAIDHGARGYIPKSSSPDIFKKALELVDAGGIYLPPHILDGRAGQQFDPVTGLTRQDVEEKLTKRQLEALIKAAQGKPNELIADEMNISVSTAKVHMSDSYEALGVNGRSAAIRVVTSVGLVPDA